ncbi:MAG: bifunctional diaminohydroxyphosphoribosylaminopyrimidine deaminase/5-amino-6-(5-phosphoribosylamino)uracil reductase RibD [candidate division Zixibacteria bacterium]|nr:bifunctional diaminohydroxyphosphoribosylaminopyrimidine deaminase/5-amino-6-(5-phosphoribosylamino)uracil reductase RibD [candidate division Zixibacteria bacterium]
MAYKTDNENFMAQALKLAARGKGFTSPNPAVGCVIVKNGRVIAGDYHHEAGLPHAEALALNQAGAAAKNADLYVTLEPCCSYGRTPPCTEAIIKAGIKRVFIGTIDPNPAVNGRGIEILVHAGIEVETGVLRKRCESLIRSYIKFITTGLPLVTIKYAQSLDGRIAAKSGASQWISSPGSLKFAHQLRSWHDAILVGANTANHDDPQLTVRLVKGNNPVRIVLSGSGLVEPGLKLFHDKVTKTILATSRKGRKLFEDSKGNCDMMTLPIKVGELNLRALLEKLAKRGITSLLIEGGSGVITSFIKQNLVDRMIIVSAPIIIGDGISGVGDLKTKTIDKARRLINIEQRKIGPDCLIMGDLA